MSDVIPVKAGILRIHFRYNGLLEVVPDDCVDIIVIIQLTEESMFFVSAEYVCSQGYRQLIGEIIFDLGDNVEVAVG